MLVLFEDAATFFGEFIGAAGRGHAGQQEGQGEQEWAQLPGQGRVPPRP
jgi:hypothetical protein